MAHEGSSNQPSRMPHSLDSEKAVLGAIIRDPEKHLGAVIEIATIEQFFIETHRKIFEVILELDQNASPIDILSVYEKLRQKGNYDEQMGTGYLVDLVNNAPIAQNIEYYAKIVKDQFFLRKIIDICRSAIAKASSGEAVENVDKLVDQIERDFIAMSDTHDQGGIKDGKKVLEDTIDVIEEKIKLGGQLSGVPSGFSDLDFVTHGWQKSNLIILAARPAMGKTALALNFATNAAKEGKKVAVFSMEMSATQLMQRVVASESRIDSSRILKGDLNEDEQDRLVATARKIHAWDGLGIDDTPDLNVSQLRSRLRRFKKTKNGLDLVVIDYLQLMRASRNFDNREREISEISKGLKALAIELDVPIISLAQLNRGPDSRTDKRPKTGDLRESGSIEQDADQIIFIYRDSYYNKESEAGGKSEILIEKNRHGSTSVVELVFIPQYVCFHSLQKT